MRPVIEKNSPLPGFTARVEREGGAVFTMTDGGQDQTLHEFLPRAMTWLRALGFEGDMSHVTLPASE
jgi:hypothetical protein